MAMMAMILPPCPVIGVCRIILLIPCPYLEDSFRMMRKPVSSEFSLNTGVILETWSW